ncbi:MAG: hypothetical protein CVU62_06680 [Deltaproteobacteria bacterium HGW-Deltaproteobacteria-2]|jgi:hypothetical protein|nr:MAG: hypothetical protein CVU62_06680 [Deltaproteobacteria bacterium HGW-Deltaproteobacteria-2]
MKKESLICFRASKALHKALARVAKEDRRSLSSTIENVLNSYLKERKAFPSVEKEKRHYPRKDLFVSAVINQPELEKMGIVTITNISLGGVRILIPKDFKQHIRIDEQNSRFEVVFNLPVENKPIKLTCESNRVFDEEDGIHVGAAFVDADFKSYKTLQTYLT